MEVKFYRCRKCGNIIMKIVDSGVTPICCGEPMLMMKYNTVDASQEKHVPAIVEIDNRSMKVQVGSKEHPMEPEHHIDFIALETESGVQISRLKEGSGPHACFCFRSKPKAVYEYCNIHGLWKKDVSDG